jgi:hypothetical protein
MIQSMKVFRILAFPALSLLLGFALAEGLVVYNAFVLDNSECGRDDTLVTGVVCGERTFGLLPACIVVAAVIVWSADRLVRHHRR